MSQSCPVTITWHNGTAADVLCVPDDWVAEPLSISGRQDVFDVPGMGVMEAYFKALGGAALELELALEADESTLLAALAMHLDLQGEWIGEDGKSGTLTIEAEDETWSAVYSPCVLLTVTPELPAGTGATTVRRVLHFVSAPPIYNEPES